VNGRCVVQIDTEAIGQHEFYTSQRISRTGILAQFIRQRTSVLSGDIR
jgi:hypothetical protein